MESLSVSLFLRNDRHQKQYNIELRPAPCSAIAPTGPPTWVVDFAYGAIGSLKPGTKTKEPTDYKTARRIYDKLLAEKTGKTCECCGGVYQATEIVAAQSSPTAQRATGLTLQSPPCQNHSVRRFVPELLEPIDGEHEHYITSAAYGAQKKFDGERLAVDWHPGLTATGYNRKGEVTTVPQSIIDKLTSSLAAPALFDGEWIPAAQEYIAFDLLECLGDDLRGKSYTERYAVLSEYGKLHAVKVAPLITGEHNKRDLHRAEKAARGEGVVFKNLAAPYMPGRQGLNVKDKFWASATVRVGKKKREDGKNSFAIEVWREFPPANWVGGETPGFELERNPACGQWWSLGTVTCTKTTKIPESGSYREIMYLYVGNGGRLVQAEDLGPRTDVDDSDCQWSKLKLKQEAASLAA